MNHAAVVKKFLKERTTDTGLDKGYPFVTISRQACAGGHTLAREILRRLEDKFSVEDASGWEVFDQKLCDLLAEDVSLKADFDSLVAEEYQSEAQQFIGDIISGQPRQYKLYKRVFQVVRLLSTIGKVVIVGRAGAFVSGDLPYGIHIRLVESDELRVKYMAKMLNVSDDAARKEINLQDRGRVRLANEFFNKDINDPVNYHMVFNTGRISIPAIADIVADMVGDKFNIMKEIK